MRELSEQAIRDIAYGSTVLGTGGGGDPYLGTLAAIESARRHGPVRLVDADELADDAVVAFPFVVGAPLPFLEKLTTGPELGRVHEGLERFLGRNVDAVMSAEVGGANSTLPMSLAALAGIPVVDGDLIGRAFPEIQLCSLTLHGIAASPIVIGDEHGNVVVVETISNHWGERLARATSICFGAICVAIAYPIAGKEAKALTLRGTISWAEQIGIALREAREEKSDGLAAVLEATGGDILFRGKIIDVDRRTQQGWALGAAVLSGMDDDAGHELVLHFQNENLVAVKDGDIVASVPDLITVLNIETGAAVTTEQLRYGARVAVLAMACHPIWRTEEGLALAGPCHWNYDHEYAPLAGRFPPAEMFPLDRAERFEKGGGMTTAGSIAHPREHALGELRAAEDLDAIVACSYEGLCYFAGTDIQTQLHLPERLEFFVAPHGAPPILLVCNIEETQVRSQSSIADVRAYTEFEDDPATELAELLSGLGIVDGRVGIEGHRLPTAAMRALEARLPAVQWVAVDRALEGLQIAKTQSEIDTLGTLARSLLSALDETIAALGASSSSEHEYASDLVSRVARTGALPLFLVFAAGPRTMLGHPEPERAPLTPGSIWRTDFGARLPGGISGDVARTGVVGAASPEQDEIFAAVRVAQDEAVAIAEPGRPARDLYTACKNSFQQSGLPFTMPHVGHGIGIGLHEAPLLEPRNDTPLPEGTVLNIEPFAILTDRGEAYHTEDMVLVGADGPRRLTEPQDALLVIG